ncbi:type II toxin-antitoxin system RelE family toxin [Candidatus Electronema sp. JC]
MGDYRIVYEVAEADACVTIVRVRHRKEVYR